MAVAGDTKSSFYTNGPIITDEFPPQPPAPGSTPGAVNPAPSSFYPDGGIYQFLDGDPTGIVAQLQTLAQQVLTNTNTVVNDRFLVDQALTQAQQILLQCQDILSQIQALVGTTTP